MQPSTVEILATVLFGLAILHTFSVKRFEHLAHKYPEGSIGENVFHLLGEVEAVFGLWAGIFLIAFTFLEGGDQAIAYLEGRHPEAVIHFTEPAFVFAIMVMAATRPVISFASTLIGTVANLLPISRSLSFFIVALVIGPLLGSFITEPAAMTVTALILKKRYYDRGMSTRFMYATIGVLFVNISIGGTLTHFAAPPVLMVAGKWGWDIAHMLEFFGYKSVLAVLINTIGVALLFRRELTAFDEKPLAAPVEPGKEAITPWWLIVIHLAFMGFVVLTAHHIVVFMGIFLFFLGVTTVTNEYQDQLKLKEGLLVGFFLGGLVVLGGFQKWWLQPLLASLDSLALFIGATGLTAVTDNAALTYLGSLVEGLSDDSKYSLVAGAVAGGGLTVIANAPNPAGYGILRGSFGSEGISPLGLLAGAIIPTLVAMACLWFLPNLVP